MPKQHNAACLTSAPMGQTSGIGLRGEETIAGLCRREARELKEVVAEQTLDKLGIPRTMFYRWYDRYQAAGPETLDLALQASGCDQAHVVHKPRLVSDTGSSYVSGELAEWLGDKEIGHVRGAPYHP